jgi:hypothetical protein
MAWPILDPHPLDAPGAENPFFAGALLSACNATSSTGKAREHMIAIYLIAAAVVVCACLFIVRRRRAR